MKKFLCLAVLIICISCKKDGEKVSVNPAVDSTKMSTLDSIQIPTFQNPDDSAAFNIVPQNISSEKGRAVFTQNGKVLFYFDQNSNTGNVKIDGKDYPLNQFDFNENNYSISGNAVKIVANDGDFKDETSDCLQGDFEEISVSLNDEKLNLSNVTVQDCPNY